MTQVEEFTDAPSARQSSPLRGWLGVVALALGSFTVVTSEMLPVGLLTPVGESLRVSEGAVGLTLTVTGLVAAVSSPLLISMLGRVDRRTALCVLVVVLVIGNLGAAWAPNFAVMVVARILVGIGMGGVWAIAAGLAVRLVPVKSVGPATSLVFSGIAVASVLGVPAGTCLGAAAGWRAAFFAAAGLGAVVLVAMAVLLPRLPSERLIPLGGVMGLLGSAQVRTGLIVVGLVVTGHFAAYTYIRPVLEDVSGVGAGMIGTLLLVYGVAGVAGNFLAGARATRSPRGTLLVISTVMAVTVVALPWLGGSVALAGVLMAVWGLSYGGVSVSTQTWILLSSRDAREAASSLFVGVFNGAIALGALVGGLAADGIGVTAVMWVGGALAVGALVTTAVGRAPTAAAGARAESARSKWYCEGEVARLVVGAGVGAPEFALRRGQGWSDVGVLLVDLAWFPPHVVGEGGPHQRLVTGAADQNVEHVLVEGDGGWCDGLPGSGRGRPAGRPSVALPPRRIIHGYRRGGNLFGAGVLELGDMMALVVDDRSSSALVGLHAEDLQDQAVQVDAEPVRSEEPEPEPAG